MVEYRIGGRGSTIRQSVSSPNETEIDEPCRYDRRREFESRFNRDPELETEILFSLDRLYAPTYARNHISAARGASSMDLDPTKNEERDLAKNNHQPPANAEELLARYAAGERAFAGARLSKAYLQGAQLSGADLSGANFSDANLEDADLRDAILQGANLQRTALRDVNLENADLTKTAGLLPAQLGGANLCGARLPDRFGDFDGLKIVEEESKNARTLFFGILLACVYGWLTIASTTDVLLLTNSSSSQLPVISASIPIVSFYIVGPLMLFVLYMYLHLHLQRLWDRLVDLPAVFPDGRSLGKRAYPWLLTGLVYSYNPYLKNRRPPLSRLQTAISLLVTWWLMPLTILLFWTRYLRRHEWIGTSLHIVVLVASISAGILLYKLAVSTLRGHRKNLLSWKQVFTSARTYAQAAWIAGLGAIFCFLSFGAIEGIHPDFESAGGEPSLINADASPADIRKWAPKMFRAIGYNPFADLREVDASTRLQNWKGQEEDEVDMVKRARLRAANLRFADATRAFLVGADLAGANLQGIYLYHANLRRADLLWADLKDSFVYEADLQGANLQHADLRGADFTGSNLSNANLKGARLDGINLEGANLNKADLSGTSLADVKGLTVAQLAAAITDAATQGPENLRATRPTKTETKPSGGKR